MHFRPFLFLFLMLLVSCVQEIPLEELENEEFVDTPVEDTPIPVVDTTAPVLSGLLPMGTLPESTTMVSLSVTTNEDASCRYDLSNKNFDQMVSSLNSSDNQTHTASLSVTNDTSYNFYVRCQDLKQNESTADVISFKVDKKGAVDTTAPLLSNLLPSGDLASGTTQTNLQVSTNEGSVCKYSSNQNANYEQMLSLSSSNGTSHSVMVNSLMDGGSYTYYVLCKDLAGNQSSKGQISFGVKNLELDGAKLYAENCMSCHGSLQNSTKKNRSASQIQDAIDFNTAMKNIAYLKKLTNEQVAAIANTLVDESALNKAPTITTLSDLAINVTEGNVASIKIVGSDPEMSNLSYILDGNISFLTKTQSGNELDIVLNPKLGDEGSYNFSIISKDSENAESNTLTFAIAVTKAVANNNVPVLSLSESTVTLEGDSTKNISISAMDQDNDTLTFSYIGKPSFVTPSGLGNSKTLAITPKHYEVGTFKFTVIVTDEKGATATSDLTIIVKAKTLDLNEQYQADFASINYRLADRFLVFSFFKSIYGDEVTDNGDIENILHDRDVFGGGCDHFEASFLPGSSTYNVISEFPGFECNERRSHFPNYTVYKARTMASSSPIRQAMVIKACERVHSSYGSRTLDFALKKAGLTLSSSANQENINQFYRLFYRHRQAPKELTDSIISKRNKFSNSTEFWKSVSLGLCISNWWQEI